MLYNNLTQFINNFDEVRAQNPNANLGFTGRLLLPGDTVLVTITTDSAEITINDLPAPTGHPIHELFAREGRILRNEASEDLGRFRQVRVWGRWHDDGSQFQSFEPYITCKIDADGEQTFSRYAYGWFGVGGESCDLVFKPMIRGRLACESIMALTVQISDIFHMPPKMVEAFGFPTGLVWFPQNEEYRLPILVLEHSVDLTRARRELEAA
jgi:hypothetical protein